MGPSREGGGEREREKDGGERWEMDEEGGREKEEEKREKYSRGEAGERDQDGGHEEHSNSNKTLTGTPTGKGGGFFLVSWTPCAWISLSLWRFLRRLLPVVRGAEKLTPGASGQAAGQDAVNGQRHQEPDTGGKRGEKEPDGDSQSRYTPPKRRHLYTSRSSFSASEAPGPKHARPPALPVKSIHRPTTPPTNALSLS